jgi:hypothetical protein
VAPADALAAEGTTITLANGAQVKLRYTMGSLRLLEARFGSLQGMQRVMDDASNGGPCEAHRTPPPAEPGQQVRKTPGHGQADPECKACEQPEGLFTALSDAIAPGLLHERVTHPDTGQTVRLGKDADLVAEHLIPGELQAYMSAWAAAFNEAMAALAGRGNAPGVPAPASAPSLGLSGTTQPPPSFTDPIGSSGA